MGCPSGTVTPPTRSEKLKRDWWIYLVLLAFSILVAIMIAKHEPWYDETKVWVIARDSNPFNLLVHYLRYEGHPGLWYMLLMVPAKLHLPNIFLNIISGVIAIISLYLFLRYSPFPVYIKILFSFSFYIFYQYAVVSRAYVLIPLLLFLIAIIYEKRTERIFLFVFLLCLLANVSLHGLLIAASILLVNLIDLSKKWAHLAKYAKRKQFIAYGIFLLIVGLIIAQLWPPADLTFAPGFNFNIGHFYWVSKLVEEYSLTGPTFAFLSLLILIITLLWFWRRKLLLLYLVPTVALLALFAIKHVALHHIGILFIVWVFALWISFKDLDTAPEEGSWKFMALKNAVIVSMVIVLSFQVVWSYKAFNTDLKNNYSSNYPVSNFIKANNLENSKIYYIGEYSVSSILYYFNKDIFANRMKKLRFDLFKSNETLPDNIYASLNKKSIEAIKKNKPDFVIVDTLMKKEYVDILPGYKLIAVTYGTEPFAGRTFLLDEILIYQRQKS